LDAEPMLPSRMVLKLPATSGANRAMAENYDLYRTESRFYSELSGMIGVQTPRCFVNLFDGDTQNLTLILEDVGDERWRGPLRPCTDEQVMMAVGELARLHGTWWQGISKTPPSWVPRLDGQRWRPQARMFTVAWSNFIDEERVDELPGLGRLAPRFAVDMDWLQIRLGSEPVTLVHGDFRISNLLFQVENGRDQVWIIDWQPLMVARGAYDLGYFLSQSISTAQRRSLEHLLLANYHSTLLQLGVRDYDFQELWSDYRLAIAYTASYAVATSLIDLVNDAGRDYARQALRRADAAVTDLDVADLVDRLAG
ncbi:MAG: oxidoreductase family protein, partial [Ilumatobacteraceae bacterium]